MNSTTLETEAQTLGLLLTDSHILSAIKNIEFLPDALLNTLRGESEIQDNPTTYDPFVLEEGSLGIPNRVRGPLFRYLQQCLQSYKATCLLIVSPQIENTDTSHRNRLCRLTRCLLTLSPRCYTLWNIRKKLLVNHLTHHNVTQELHWTGLLLRISKYAANEDAWAHRRWLLSYFDQDINSSTLKVYLTEEGHLLRHTISMYPRNYYAWNHRRWILRDFMGMVQQSTKASVAIDTYYEVGHYLWKEWRDHHHWVARNPDDFSAYHNLLTVIQALGQWLIDHPKDSVEQYFTILAFTGDSGNPASEFYTLLQASTLKLNQVNTYQVGLIALEIAYARDMLWSYPEQESAWYHLRNVTALLNTTWPDPTSPGKKRVHQVLQYVAICLGNSKSPSITQFSRMGLYFSVPQNHASYLRLLSWSSFSVTDELEFIQVWESLVLSGHKALDVPSLPVDKLDSLGRWAQLYRLWLERFAKSHYQVLHPSAE
ncbi:hypothetical protein IWQ61_001760 [Dispira simplex]|nr:hypothetical protein IWQ61_001760 [Dispira simplex]